jgi:hypothetical protein
VKVGDALNELLEETQAVLLALLTLEVTLLNQAEEIAFGAVLHNVVPTGVVGAEAEGLDNVGMVQTLGDTELGLDLVLVVLFALTARLTTEFLDGIEFLGVALAHHEPHLGGSSLSEMLAMTAKELALILKLAL